MNYKSNVVLWPMHRCDYLMNEEAVLKKSSDLPNSYVVNAKNQLCTDPKRQKVNF